jgi:hypothetical protein
VPNRCDSEKKMRGIDNRKAAITFLHALLMNMLIRKMNPSAGEFES